MLPFRLSAPSSRACLLDPQGRPFFSLGVVHAGAYPEGDGQAFFDHKYAGDWSFLAAKIAADLRDWGFNSAGYHSPPALLDHLPYFQDCYPAAISYWMGAPAYPDPFDPAWQRAVEDLLERTCAPVRDHPNLVGYYWTDTPRWDLDRARRLVSTDWVSAIRALPAAAPGKQAYVDYLLEAAFEAGPVYRAALGGTALNRDNLLESTFARLDLSHPAVMRHDRGFLRRIARQYYAVAHMATRKADPDHLIFGDRYLIGDHPPEVLEEAAPFIDVLSVQPYGSAFDRAAFDALHALTGKPILICDHAINFATPAHPHTVWPQAPDEAAAARAYHAYLTAAAQCPYITGYHRCQYIDRPIPGTDLLKQGLLQADETPYAVLLEQVRATNRAVAETFRCTIIEA